MIYLSNKGEPKVKPNQYVRPGDILVSGVIGTAETQQIVPAKGRCWEKCGMKAMFPSRLLEPKTVLYRRNQG